LGAFSFLFSDTAQSIPPLSLVFGLIWVITWCVFT
jgi:hypothetical protein